MSPILVDVDALNVLAIDVAPTVEALVNHQATFACLVRKMGKRSAIEAGADN